MKYHTLNILSELLGPCIVQKHLNFEMVKYADTFR